MFKQIIIFFAFWLPSLISIGQLDSILVVFTAIVDDDQIILNWTMAGGYQCNGTSIERSVDGEKFNQIGNIPGLCGDPQSDESYSYVDTLPVLNSVNYYRLNLQFYGVSHVIQRELFKLTESGFLILPNPVIDIGKIKFDNPYHDEFVLQLFSLNGQLVYSEITNLDYFIVNSSILKNGIYVFVIRSDNAKIIKGKIVIGNI